MDRTLQELGSHDCQIGQRNKIICEVKRAKSLVKYPTIHMYQINFAMLRTYAFRPKVKITDNIINDSFNETIR